MMASGLFVLAALGLVIRGVWRLRRRPSVLNDTITRPSTAILVGILVAFFVLSFLQGLPRSLANYDTEVPWEMFVATLGATGAFAAVGALILAALWQLANAMRRRAGIPLALALPPGGTRASEVELGLAIGAVFALRDAVLQWMVTGPASAPSTTLDQVMPLLAGAVDRLSSIGVIPLMVIPALSVLGMSDRPRSRQILAVCFLLCLVGAGADAGDLQDPLRLASNALLLAAVALALVSWGRVSALTWVIAAAASGAADALRAVLRAPTGLEQGGGALDLSLCVLLIWIAVRWSRSVESAAPA
jgi:hypothetical protein